MYIHSYSSFLRFLSLFLSWEVLSKKGCEIYRIGIGFNGMEKTKGYGLFIFVLFFFFLGWASERYDDTNRRNNSHRDTRPLHWFEARENEIQPWRVVERSARIYRIMVMNI